MTEEYAKHEKNLIRELQKKGYTANYIIKDNTLVDVDTKKEYTSDEVTIVGEHRYEGMSNPSDMSILYALKTKDGRKGTYLAGYGPSADMETAEFFKNVNEVQG
ncbi:hypothetical protein [Allomuricauda sp. d1]|uniref:hypothetical protein n=1 Tax=Allomuricauda sp. d1 TaxID=3136725 RepID=UPI0031CFE01B